MKKRTKPYYFCILLAFALTGCAPVVKKEDIFLQAQKIKAANVAVQTAQTPNAVQPAPTLPVDQPAPVIIPVPTPVLVALPPPEPIAAPKNLPAEKLVYKSKFLGLGIGDFVIINKGKVTIKDRQAYCFDVTVKTLPFFSSLFKTKERYVSYTDAETFLVLRHEEYIKGGALESATEFDHANHTAHYQNFVTKKEQTVPIPSKIIDVIGGAFYLRTLPMVIGDTPEMELYADEKIYNFVGLVHSKTKVNGGGKSREAYLFKPYVFLNGKQITKVSAEVFFSTNETKTPLRANLKTPLGTVSVILIE